MSVDEAKSNDAGPSRAYQPAPPASGPAADRVVDRPAGRVRRRLTVAQVFDREVLWTLAVGVPVLVSVLRLWAEAGGDLQTTLLLVSNVGPINLFAALVVTATWLVSAVLIAVFAVGTLTADSVTADGVTVSSGADDTDAGRDRPLSWPALFAQLTDGAPRWMRVAAFLLAVLTWKVLYLPLLVLALFIITGWRREPSRWRITGILVVLAGYLVVFGPTLVSAVRQGYVLPATVIAAPPILLALGAADPVPASFARWFAHFAQGGTVVLLTFAMLPMLATPVLPLSVVTVSEGAGQPPQPVRGHVVEVNDTTTAVLRVQGGVEFIPNEKIVARLLCPDQGQAARYRLWAHGVHIEDSLLQGIGRQRRPVITLDPRCRPTVPEREPGRDFNP